NCELASFIGQRNRYTVDFQLDHVFDRLAAKLFADTPIKFAKLIGAVSVIDGEHRQSVSNLREFTDGLAADPLGGAFRIYQFRMLGLDLLQLFEQLVELAIGNLRLSFGVIQVVVVVDELAQFRGAFGGGRHCRLAFRLSWTTRPDHWEELSSWR